MGLVSLELIEAEEMKFRFPSYAAFVSSMGYCPADPSVIERDATSIWRVSQNGNLYRNSDSRTVRVTVCVSRNGSIGYVWNVGADSGWVGPFDNEDEAMDDADLNFFG